MLLPSERIILMNRCIETTRYIGNRLRLRRKALHLTQVYIGDKIGVAFQQIQKYETGLNRIGSCTLLRLSNILEVPITYFYEGLPEYKATSVDPMQTKEAIGLVTAFNKIKDPKVKNNFYNLITGLQ